MLAREKPSKALRWLGKQLFNRENPAAFFDPLLESLNPMWVRGYTPARVEQVLKETAETKTFILKPTQRWSGFEAGQHVNICTEIDGRRHTRPFSLSSSPVLWQEQGVITLTIKRLPGGLVTNWLHDRLEVGAVLGMSDAFGDFLIPEPAAPVLFIAGGSGITPILSQLETMATQDYRAPITLLYFVRTHEDVIAGSQLNALAARYPALTLNIVATHLGASPRYLSDKDLDTVPGLKARKAFLCGPRGLMELAEHLLRGRGIRQSDIHCTFFAAPSAGLSDQAVGGQVQFTESSLEVGSQGDANLLEIAEAAGLSPRYGCRMGICHQCSCRKTSGTVINRLTGQPSGRGEEMVQLCISVPQGPVSIEA
ncbi:ferredoxin reductase [Marinobacter sp. F4216]|uniref:ferredoxin reductase n=1 Tax=Marinobacter sp. F4216 TaxID=2874281 RepID=UPI001CC0B77C|nr:ferredoxin reductase [Marinobacter sp. F4216]MBZ2168854.1 2Fe-2S iron-sulfur cluster binding domain-containing protein [Marinobacter sp. F4216]